MPHRELRDQAREPGPLGRVRRRPPQVLIDHHHPGGGPAQRDRPLGQPVLQPRRLTVIGDLLARRLPDVNDRQGSRCQPWIFSSPRSRGTTVLIAGPLRYRQPLQEHAQQPQNVAPGRLRKRGPQFSLPDPRQRRLGRMPASAPSTTPRLLRIACPQPLSPLHQPEQALPADNRHAYSRSSNDPCTTANRLKASGPSSNAAPSPTSPAPASTTSSTSSSTDCGRSSAGPASSKDASPKPDSPWRPMNNQQTTRIKISKSAAEPLTRR
jgi:hypothetical protein